MKNFERNPVLGSEDASTPFPMHQKILSDFPNYWADETELEKLIQKLEAQPKDRKELQDNTIDDSVNSDLAKRSLALRKLI